MRVLYSFPHALGKPGISTTAFHQIQGLIDQGATVDVVCTSLQRDLRGARRVVETLKLAGQRVPHRALGVHRAYAYHDRRAARTLERIQAEIDVVHTWPAGCSRTLAVARRFGIPSFREAPSAHTQTAYEDAAREADSVGVELPPDHHHRYDARHLDRELQEFAAADFLLVPSRYAEQSFLDRGHAPAQLIRHRYGFDPASFPLSADVASRNGNGLTVAFVGRGEPNKGLHLALRAWVESGAGEQGRLLVCGDVLPSYRERLSALLGHPSVDELGFVDDVGRVMRDAEILILPSVTEGSALVTYEAQAAGCALLVSEAAGAPCEHLREGLVHPTGDVRTLAGHIRLLDRDRELLHRLRAGALRNAAGLTWSDAAERLVGAYAEGLDRYSALLAEERVEQGELSQVGPEDARNLAHTQ
jgi:glycosyltransferase involved in cell wall biosynthesis